MYKVFHDLFGRHGIERGDGLVCQNDVRILRQGARQRDALLLTAGELVGAHIGLVQNADLVKGLERPDFILFAERTQKHAPERHVRHAGGEHVFNDARARDEIKRLEHHADSAPEFAKGFAGKPGHVGTVYGKAPGGDLVHPVHSAQER